MAKKLSKVPKVVVIVDCGRVDRVICDETFDVEILETDLDNVEDEALVKIDGTCLSYYRGFEYGVAPEEVARIFKAITKKRLENDAKD